MAGAVEVVAPEPDSAVQVGRVDVGEADHATAVYHNSPSNAAKAQEVVVAVVADSLVRSLARYQLRLHIFILQLVVSYLLRCCCC